jgi:single-stranded-DNA-specific exonuclease
MNIPSSLTASGLPWQLRAEDSRSVLAMAQQQGISELLASIMVGRGIALDDAARFLNPSLRDDMPDPSHLLDMDKAVSRIITAMKENQPIAIFGDYDVDGATSTGLLLDYFAQLGISVRPYIPDRMKEGYGPTVEGFKKLIGQGVKLLVTVDCGTMAHEPIAFAKAQGVDVIVVDHHLSSGALPDAYAVVNPNRADETSACTNLAAVGVVFLLLVALNKGFRDSGLGIREVQSPIPNTQSLPNLLSMLDRVALGTVCDVMPLTGLNRTFVTQGLKVLAKRNNIGLAALADVARLDELPSTYHLGFLLGPRINAGGRVGESGLGVELLTTADADHAAAIAARLDQYNTERQAIEASVSEKAFAQAEAQQNMPVMLLTGEGWHQGVIGIVAGRLKKKYSRPVAVISLENGIGKASARSVTGADMGAAVHAAQVAGLITSGGGHAMAAGFSLAEAQIPALHSFLIERMGAAVAAYNESRVMKLDGWVSCQSANLELLDDIARGGPYGIGNPGPRFAIHAARIVRFDILKEKHIRCILTDEVGTQRLTAIAFNAVGTILGEWVQTSRQLHVAGEIKRNVWQGTESVQLIINDVAKIA